jgi:LuxR family transcriptional regulator, maltose regulon positive regulatory protein
VGATWLLKAKLAPPKQMVAMHPRDRLTARLTAGRSRKLTMIEAPAGFGKTTLLAQWRELLLAQHVRVAWLTLDEDDTAERLISYLALSLAGAGADLEGTGLLAEDRRGLPSGAPALHSILDALTRGEGEIALILDDVERLKSREAQHQLETLIQYAPDNLHIAIAGRSNPGLSIAHLSLMGVVNHMDAGSLRFTSSEATAYLKGCAPEAATMLADIDRAQGWPVALQILRSMATRAHSSAAPPASVAAGVAASYFTEQLARLLQPHQLAFLCDISLLNETSIELADHVRETHDAQHILRELDHLSPLIPPLEGAAGQFRLHPMLREHFAELALADPARCMQIHRRAAEWFAAGRKLSLALRHAVTAGDKILTGALIVRSGGVSIWIRHGMAEVVAANELIDGEMIAAMPRLGLMRAIVLIKQSRLHEARAQYERVAAATANFSVDPSTDDASTLSREGLFILSMLVIYCCLPLSEAHLNSLDQGLHDPAADDVELAHHKTVLCVTYLQSGNFEAAWRYGEEAAAHCRAFGSIYGTNFVDFHTGSIAMARGDVDQAVQRYEKGRRKTRRHFAHDLGLRIVGDVLTAELHLERNAIAHVKSRLARVIGRLHDAEAWYEIYAAAYGTASELTFLERGLDETLGFLEQAQDRAEHLRLNKLVPLIDALRVTALTLAGATDRALRVAEGSPTNFPEAGLDAGPGAAWREVEALATAWTRLMLRCQRYEEAQRCADRAISFAQTRGIARMVLRLNVLAAGCADARGERDLALACVSEVCREVARTGYVRAVLREGPPVASLLSNIGPLLPSDALVRQALDLATLFAGDAKSRDRRPVLSPRELDVLQHLDRGMQDKVIARHLGVTEHAVRFHLKNIYAKTQARGRMEAVARARQLGILDPEPY